MIPHGRPPFPLDAPTPLGYKIGIGRGARPLSSSNAFIQQLKKRKTPESSATEEDPTRRIPPPSPEASSIDTDVKALVKGSRAHISRKDWEHIPECSREVPRRKQVSSHTVNLGTNQTVRPNELFEATKLLGSAHAKSKNSSNTVLHEIVREDASQSPGGDGGAIPAEYAVESTHLHDMEELDQQISYIRSLCESHPENSAHWIDLAHLHLQKGERKHAQRMLQKCCQTSPHEEVLWMEYLKLVESVPEGKSVCTIALEHIPDSASLWKVLADKYTPDITEKQNVLLEAVENVPQNAVLWKSLIDAFQSSDEKLMVLEKAMECVEDVEIYLEFARLEPDSKIVRKKLSEARRKFPDRPEIYIAAAREEATDHEKVEMIVRKAFEVTRMPDVILEETHNRFDARGGDHSESRIERLAWYLLAEGQRDEPVVLAKIVQFTVNFDAEGASISVQRSVWLADAALLYDAGLVDVSRALLAYAVEVLPHAQDLWMARIHQMTDRGERLQTLNDAVGKCPKSPALWESLADFHRSNGKLESLCETLENAVERIPSSEDMWIALAKGTEERFDDPAATRKIYDRACVSCPTPRMHLKKYTFERRIGDVSETALASSVEKLLLQGRPFSAEWELWALAIELASADTALSGRDYENAKRIARLAISENLNVVKIWQLAVAVELQAGQINSGRSLYLSALEKMPESSALHASFIQFLIDQKDFSVAKDRFQTALKLFRHNASSLGDIYSAGVMLDSIETRISSIHFALSISPDHEGLLWRKAHTLYQLGMRDDVSSAARKLVELYPKNGDAWALRCLCEADAIMQLPTGENAPTYGTQWEKVARNPMVLGHDGCLLDTADIVELVMEHLRSEASP
ncbi:TPR repeat-containing protein [Perkinsela sp. CCAP 1560/4]|nr:TPR repeat-containing protein [Perkinsela sp. CCAP 1560/4]|eukprot:KNH07305.1 TPR repeat-containing protein [Perkinsela sp. CCAP 1560/4]